MDSIFHNTGKNEITIRKVYKDNGDISLTTRDGEAWMMKEISNTNGKYWSLVLIRPIIDPSIQNNNTIPMPMPPNQFGLWQEYINPNIDYNSNNRYRYNTDTEYNHNNGYVGHNHNNGYVGHNHNNGYVGQNHNTRYNPGFIRFSDKKESVDNNEQYKKSIFENVEEPKRNVNTYADNNNLDKNNTIKLSSNQVKNLQDLTEKSNKRKSIENDTNERLSINLDLIEQIKSKKISRDPRLNQSNDKSHKDSSHKDSSHKDSFHKDLSQKDSSKKQKTVTISAEEYEKYFSNKKSSE
jgi:hypothetical protein